MKTTTVITTWKATLEVNKEELERLVKCAAKRLGPVDIEDIYRDWHIYKDDEDMDPDVVLYCELRAALERKT